ncbi:MAG: adenosylmethionine decarboxylase, partial [Bacteroidota bacterium]
MKYLGKHYLLELYDCPADILSDPKFIGEKMKKAAQVMKASIVESTFHHFNPLGVSGVIIIKESHLTIHTWPEYGYAAVDIFTCGKIDMDNGISYLRKALKSEKVEIKKLGRGASK